MHPALKIICAILVGICALALLIGESRADGGARTNRGKSRQGGALVYHYDAAFTDTYISAVHPPAAGRLARLLFDVNTPGEGAGHVVFAVRRYQEADGGYSSPICQVTVPCAAPASPDGGHLHSDVGFECDEGAIIGEVAGELLTVEVLSQDCAGANTPEGNITLYLEF